jgi:hypothetical protein
MLNAGRLGAGLIGIAGALALACGSGSTEGGHSIGQAGGAGQSAAGKGGGGSSASDAGATNMGVAGTSGMSSTVGGTASGGAGGVNGVSGGAGSSAGSLGAGGGACNDIDNVGTDVKDKSAPGVFPFLGPQGTPVDGTYVLTSAVAYDGIASLYSRNRTLLIQGHSLQSVTSVDSGPAERVSFTIAPSDLLNQVPICGAEGDWVSGLSIAYSFRPQGTLEIREVVTKDSAAYPKWPNRLDTYTLVK